MRYLKNFIISKALLLHVLMHGYNNRKWCLNGTLQIILSSAEPHLNETLNDNQSIDNIYQIVLKLSKYFQYIVASLERSTA